jgi:predicted DNA-binding protein YlxM (UPF0122 family)
MKAEILVNITYNQVLELVRKLPKQEKIKLRKELEKEEITNKLSKLLKAFKTNDLSVETIDKEVELVRQEMYENKL